ncbi:MAG: TMEM143 family protein [Geitlerinemataceae cyanobacterium]
MAVYADRDAFIPYRRSDLVELCLSEGKLDRAAAQQFREFAEILAAYYHFEFHRDLEIIKDSFAPFNPDSATKSIRELTTEESQERQERLVHAFEHVLERANYQPISKESLERAFEEEALIELKTDVQFDDFEYFSCFCRGDIFETVEVKKFFKKKPVTIDVFERVALLMKYKDADYFEAQGAKLEKLKFTPGKFYVALYKNVPKSDLEFLFPNVKVSMTLKDRLTFFVPAIGAAVPILIKVLPQLLLIVGVVMVLIPNVEPPDSGLLQATEEDAQNLSRLMLTILSMLVVLGGFAFKQYSKYQSKQLKFQKNVSDTLFFRNIASNASVFNSLIDSAEEEECKEILLVYYHLLTKGRAMTRDELDDTIETWMEEKFGTKIDFDINGPLGNLAKLKGEYIDDDGDPVIAPLLSVTPQKRYRVLSLERSKQAIDWIWDNAFSYSDEAEAEPIPAGRR